MTRPMLQANDTSLKTLPCEFASQHRANANAISAEFAPALSTTKLFLVAGRKALQMMSGWRRISQPFAPFSASNAT